MVARAHTRSSARPLPFCSIDNTHPTLPPPSPPKHHAIPPKTNKHTSKKTKKNQDTISLTVVENGLVTNASLGSFKLSVPEVVRHRQRSRWTKAEQAGYYHRAFPITAAGEGGATLEVEMEFLPYW